MTKRGIDGEAVDGLDVRSSTALSLSVGRALDCSLALGSSHAVPQMPWESNPFLRDVLGPPTVPWLKPPTISRSLNHVPVKAESGQVFTVLAKKEKVRLVACSQLHSAPDADRAKLLIIEVE